MAPATVSLRDVPRPGVCCHHGRARASAVPLLGACLRAGRRRRGAALGRTRCLAAHGKGKPWRHFCLTRKRRLPALRSPSAVGPGGRRPHSGRTEPQSPSEYGQGTGCCLVLSPASPQILHIARGRHGSCPQPSSPALLPPLALTPVHCPFWGAGAARGVTPGFSPPASSCPALVP